MVDGDEVPGGQVVRPTRVRRLCKRLFSRVGQVCRKHGMAKDGPSFNASHLPRFFKALSRGCPGRRYLFDKALRQSRPCHQLPDSFHAHNQPSEGSFLVSPCCTPFFASASAWLASLLSLGRCCLPQQCSGFTGGGLLRGG